MNNELKFDLKQLRVLLLTFRYSQYFPVVLPSVIIIICVGIVLLFFVPQVNSWFSIQDEIQQTQERISKAKNNLELLQSSNTQNVDADFYAATAALPPQKDFAVILTALTNAASVAQITMDDFSFAIGEVSQDSEASVSAGQQRSVPVVANENGMFPVRVSITAGGTLTGVNAFVREIEEKLPLTQVESVDFTEGKAQVSLTFFTRPFPEIIFNETEPISVLSPQDRLLLQKLSEKL